MSTRYAIMLSLMDRPNTGYGLNKSFQASIGFFWKATHQQIYKELEHIQKLGWAAVKVEPQKGKPDRKVYSLTRSGIHALKEWCNSETQETSPNNLFLAKLFAGHLIDNDRLILALEKRIEKHAKDLKRYLEIETQYFKKDEKLTKQRMFHYITLRYGIQFEAGNLTWCKETLSVLRRAE